MFNTSGLRNMVRQIDVETTTDGKLSSLLKKVIITGSKEVVLFLFFQKY